MLDAGVADLGKSAWPAQRISPGHAAVGCGVSNGRVGPFPGSNLGDYFALLDLGAGRGLLRRTVEQLFRMVFSGLRHFQLFALYLRGRSPNWGARSRGYCIRPSSSMRSLPLETCSK